MSATDRPFDIARPPPSRHAVTFILSMLTAIMSKRVPEDAQGEWQGGLSALTKVAMLLGTAFSAQVVGYFMSDAAPFRSPDVAYYVAGAGLGFTVILFLWLVGHDGEKI